jgi:hypothetical protein
MFGRNFDKQRAGRPVRARTLNRPIAEVERLARLRVGTGLAQTLLNGIPLLRAFVSDTLLARIAGQAAGSALYAWQEVSLDGTGTFVDGARSGSTSVDPALEQNGNTQVPSGTRVQLVRVGGQLVFQLSPCSPNGKAPPVPPLPLLDQGLWIVRPPPDVLSVAATAPILNAGPGHPVPPPPPPPP